MQQVIGWTTKTDKAFGSRYGRRNLCRNSMHTKLLCNGNILIFVLYIRIWHGDLNLRYQSKGNHGGEVNVCQALAGAPDSSYKSSKKSIHLC